MAEQHGADRTAAGWTVERWLRQWLVTGIIRLSKTPRSKDTRGGRIA